MFTIKNYVMAKELGEAYELNKKSRNNIVMGGNLWLKMGNRNIQKAIDLSMLGLNEIEEEGESFCIGCMCSLRDMETNEALNQYFNGAIKEALCKIVGVQFRNCATLGGSLFPRFGFSDVLSVLLALDTYVELYDKGIVPLKEFVNLPKDDDILVDIFIKKDNRKVSYQSHRNTQTDFPALTCAVSLFEGKFSVVLGARPAKAVLIDDVVLEDPTDEKQVEAFAKEVVSKVTFGSNIRGSKEYREELAKIFIARGIEEIMGGSHDN